MRRHSHDSSQPEREDCPLCRGTAPNDLVRAIRTAEPGKPMAEEFAEWLRAF